MPWRLFRSRYHTESHPHADTMKRGYDLKPSYNRAVHSKEKTHTVPQAALSKWSGPAVSQRAAPRQEHNRKELKPKNQKIKK